MDQNEQNHNKKDKHPFNSNVARTIGTHMPSSNPGPGAYTPIINNYNLKNVKKKRNNFYEGFDWIISEPRSKDLGVFQNNKHVGPDTYQVEVSSKSPQYTWGKSKRFDEKLTKLAKIGPGYYNYEQKRETAGAEAVFRSRVPKHIENNGSESSPTLNNKANGLLLSSMIQRVDPNNQASSSINKPEKSSFFASKVPRFQYKNISPTNKIGPGSYTFQNEDIKIKRTSPKPIQGQKNVNNKQLSPLGPGCYDLNNYSLSNQLDKKGYAISKETRFNFKTKKVNSTMLPGPGQYMQQKYLYADRDQLFKHYYQQNKKTKSFSHSILEDKLREKNIQRQGSPQFYDVKVFDISYELKKKKLYYQNLKELKVELAPFNSKANRLS